MLSKDTETLSEICREMYDSDEDIINENNKNKSIRRDVNQEILDLLKSQGISDEEIQTFVDFMKNQASYSTDYEASDRFRDLSP